MKKIMLWMMAAILTICGATALTSCNKSDNPVSPEKSVTLEDSLNNGNLVAFTFNLNGADYYVVFLKVGDTYELLDVGLINANGNGNALTRANEPAISEQDCEFTMEEDKANNLLKFIVKEKKTGDLILTAIFDIKQSTFEVIPGNSQYTVTGFKMKVSDVEITQMLKDNGGSVTLAHALVKGSKVEIAYKWNEGTTTFTFTNEGGNFSCKITGDEAEMFTGSLKSEGSTLTFRADHWLASECNFALKFDVLKNTFKYWTVKHEIYTSHTVSVNGTDITKTLTKED